MANKINLSPQPGKQTQAFNSKADIIIYGGSENPVDPCGVNHIQKVC